VKGGTRTREKGGGEGREDRKKDGQMNKNYLVSKKIEKKLIKRCNYMGRVSPPGLQQ
jgi:hypothetical protein